MKAALIAALAAGCLAAPALAAPPSGHVAPGAVGVPPPVRVERHGKRLTLGSGDSRVTALYLRGTPYEMGFAHGKLCAAEVRYFAKTVARKMIAGMATTPQKVDAAWALHKKHLRPEYLEELRGLADGSGVPLKEIERIHAIPDLSEWHCSFFAAVGPASRGGDLIQIRALDYETGVGIQKHPALLVYQPKNGVPFVNVGWLGQCGLVSGMNAAGIALSEIGDDWDRETDTFDGRPLNYVMRDALQFGRTLEEAIRQIRDRPRTTSLLYCLSSAREGQVRALQTSHAQCKVFSPSNLPFPTQPGLVYLSMGMNSAWNRKVGDALAQEYRRLDVRGAQLLMQRLKTGSLHAVVFQPGTGDLWVANAGESVLAYDRPYRHFSLKKALSDPFFSR